jgi:Ca-activated chloride channel family protein
MNDSSQTEGILIQHNGQVVPLVGVDVQADIAGRGAKVKISQQFKNTEKKSIEAVYKFPLPENAAVCGFRALIDGRIVEGKIEEKERAFELYDKALSEGYKAQLMDEERPNIFTLSVGNIEPGGSVIIEITYITLLDSYNSAVRFFLPTTISPRFTPASQEDENGIPIRALVNPPFAFKVPYGLTINVNIAGKKAIASIESPSHTINTSFKNDEAHVTFSADKVSMDRDFILTITYEKDFTNRAYISQYNDETFLQIDLTPAEATEENQANDLPKGREIVFVLDCSGSMQGDSIEEAKKALEILIKALSTDMMFNIYRFGNVFDHLFKSSKPYNEKNMKEALKYLSKTDASMGGTQILPPLADIYKEEPADGFRRDVILITDGEISNEDEVMELVQRHNNTTALSAVGIGNGPNEFLIKAVARVAGGTSELIAPQERIEPKVLRLFQKVLAKRISNLEIDCGSAIDQAPACPVAFMRQATSIFVKIKKSDFQGKGVTVKQYNHQGTISRKWNIDLEEVNDETMPISKMWAREKIRDLEEGSGLMAGTRQRQRVDVNKQKTVTAISRQYGIISRSTSFIGIEKNAETENKSSDMVLRVVPTGVTKGWHGMPMVPLFLRKSPVEQYSIRQISDDDMCVHESNVMPAYLRRADSGNKPFSPFRKAARGIRNMLSHIRETDPLLDILSQQRLGGGFNMNKRIYDILQISDSKLYSVADDMQVKNGTDRLEILTTAIILAFLELKFGDRKNEWEAVVLKSRSYLEDQIKKFSPTIDGEPLQVWAARFVQDMLKALQTA